MITSETLDSLLEQWARFYLAEFNEVSWQKTSISGRLIEYAKLGVSSNGTKHLETNFHIPESVLEIQNALITLPLIQQKVIKIEYTEFSLQRIKARKLKIKLYNYRAHLCRAKQKLMQII
jgi:hypothetical protein